MWNSALDLPAVVGILFVALLEDRVRVLQDETFVFLVQVVEELCETAREVLREGDAVCNSVLVILSDTTCELREESRLTSFEGLADEGLAISDELVEDVELVLGSACHFRVEEFSNVDVEVF